jgi:hypothetical protein
MNDFHVIAQMIEEESPAKVFVMVIKEKMAKELDAKLAGL